MKTGNVVLASLFVAFLFISELFVSRIDDDSKEDLKVTSGLEEAAKGEDSIIRDLSQALLQVLKMIETKYLNPPLGKLSSAITSSTAAKTFQINSSSVDKSLSYDKSASSAVKLCHYWD